MALDNLEIEVRIFIRGKNAEAHSAAFGRGIAKLCEGVEETGSLNKACKKIGMAYSKAWQIIRDTEQSLGVTLLDRQGAHGSVLTEEAKALLKAFHEAERTLKANGQVVLESALLAQGAQDAS